MKHSIVFFNKQAIVIGPTPPGTGVKAFATFETSSKSTSPTKPFSVLFMRHITYQSEVECVVFVAFLLIIPYQSARQ